MSMPIFTDEQPAIEVRGNLFVYTFAFGDEQHQIVLTRHAAIRTAMLTLQSLGEPPNEAWIKTLETYAECEAAS